VATAGGAAGASGAGTAAEGWNPHTALGNSLSGNNYRIRGNYLDDHATPSKEESAAARLLLKHTVADPQQRLAKMGLTGKMGVIDGSPSKGFSVFPHMGATSTGAVLLDPAMGPDDMGIRDAYRSLHSQFVELQIELETARTDRDSLHVVSRSYCVLRSCRTVCNSYEMFITMISQNILLLVCDNAVLLAYN
jgi:hypothetical protein